MTVKVIGAALQAHFDLFGTTTCRLLKMTARDGTSLGLTSLDASVLYDDGSVDLTYSAPIGFENVAFEKSAALDVDNSEAKMLLADSGPFTSEFIEAGNLDYGTFVVYRINWGDATATPNGLRAVANRHEIVASGTIGIVKNVDGVSGVIELRGLPQLLKQNYMQLYSVTCRAKFGSGGGGTCVGRGECGYDAEALWQNLAVDSVGTETDRIFTADGSPTGSIPFVPGVVHWLTGDNAGLQSEVEEIDGANITLRFGTPYAIQAGDTFKIRPDCDKTWATCRDVFTNEEHFRGEPFIPLADERSQGVPSPVIPGEPGPAAPETPPPDPPDPPPDPPDPPPASTEIVNPGFESGDTGWTKGVGWSITGRDPRTGSRSAELYSANVQSSIRQSTLVAVTPSQSVQASCYVKRGSPGTTGGRVLLTWYDGDENYLSESAGSTVTSGSYSQSTISVSAPGSAAFVTVGCESVNPVFGKVVFADDFTWNL